METITIRSGLEALDEVVQGIRLGDNVVWQLDQLEDYGRFVRPFVEQAVAERRRLVYMRFAPHPPVLEMREGLARVDLDPRPGFDHFTSQVHQVIERHGRGAFYVFDNLSALAVEWATDELLANFFKVTCPFLFELDTVAYFALTRGRHAHTAVARIRDTTQILIDVYRIKDQVYVHPIKVWDRYSPQMFLPHLASGDRWEPLSGSHQASEVLASARQSPLRGTTRSIAPWESVYQKLVDYATFDETDPEQAALKQELCRMMIGYHPFFSRLVDRYFSLGDLLAIRERMVGSGRIGGKAAGMLLARRILQADGEGVGPERLEEHDSFYIGSDVFFTFLVDNDLFRLRLQLTRSSFTSPEEYEQVERRFLAGRFAPAVVEQFRALLDYYGQSPIIVRSSSLLEDSLGNAFAGKYLSVFCANQGGPDERLEGFMQAVKRVYASALNPDALSYRSKRGLGESDEQMAILVQRVSGTPYQRYFFPPLAGVAFSRNLFAWSDRIDPEQGIIRLVFGLGTRAVDRVGSDYPRMVAISHPHLRPEVGPRIAKYSQRQVDVLDLAANRFESRALAELLDSRDYPNLYMLVSVLKEGHPYDPISARVEGDARDWVLTFNNLLGRTDFVPLVGKILARLERVYEHPVDIEFTASLDDGEHVRLNLLQCRPLFLPGSAAAARVPADLRPEQVLFRAQRMICGGAVERIRYILYIDPQAYPTLDVQLKRSLGRLVGQINRHPAVQAGKIVMMGPGRWGSSNIELGVNVGYADIDNASVLVEIAREEAGHVPEVSYGTHFFQDLVEAQIIYLPLYPDDAAAQFQAGFFENAPDVLLELLPQAGMYKPSVRLIDVPAAAGGAFAHVAADPQQRRAVCFLSP